METKKMNQDYENEFLSDLLKLRTLFWRQNQP